MTLPAQVARLRLLPVATPGRPPGEAQLTQDNVMDLARRLREHGWQISVAFESGDDAERFTLSGVHAP